MNILSVRKPIHSALKARGFSIVKNAAVIDTDKIRFLIRVDRGPTSGALYLDFGIWFVPIAPERHQGAERRRRDGEASAALDASSGFPKRGKPLRAPPGLTLWRKRIAPQSWELAVCLFRRKSVNNNQRLTANRDLKTKTGNIYKECSMKCVVSWFSSAILAIGVSGCAENTGSLAPRPESGSALSGLVASGCLGSVRNEIDGSKIDPAKQREAVATGWEAVENGDGRRAAAAFFAAVAWAPDDPESLWGLAVGSHMANMPPSVVDLCLARARPGLDNVAEFYADAGKIWGERGELDRAEGALKIALKLKPEHLPTYAHLVALEHNRGNEAAAERYARDAEKYMPK